MKRKLWKKEILAFLLAFAMICSMISVSVLATETVQIGNEAELIAFANRVNSGEAALDAVLNADITLTDEWSAIGLKAKPYSGTFDGKGHTVTFTAGIKFIDTNERYGFFDTISGGTVQNLVVAGTIDLSSKAGNVGGIVGYLTGNVKNCLNKAQISGKNNVGGIAGMSSKGAVDNCGNVGAITAASNNAGGIIGSSMYDPAITNCYNRGAIQCASGNNNAGGIVANCTPLSIANPTIKNVYNTGMVSGGSNIGAITGKQTANKINYVNAYYLEGSCAKGMGNGAALSGTADSKNEADLKTAILTIMDDGGAAVFAEDSNTINEGWPILAWQGGGSATDTPLGGSLSISGKLYVGGMLNAVYTGDEAVSYQWYRGDTAIEDAATNSYVVTTDDIGSSIIVEVSADGYISKTEGAGTVPNFVTFDVSPATAALTVKDADQQEWQDTEGFYALPAGEYSYTASLGGEYEDASGTFTMPYTQNNGIITVTLPVKTYEVIFATVPAEAAFEIKKDGEIVEPTTAGTKQYQLAKGEYTYSASAFGYESKTDELLAVSGAETKNITLTALPLQQVAIKINKEAGGADTTPNVVVRDAMDIVRDYTKGLPAGNYTYAISCGGYNSVSGSFEVSDSRVDITVNLEIQTAWDGTTKTEPMQDSSGTYLIGSTAELYWFGQEAPKTANGKLIADITINKDMSAAEENLYKWTPIGSSSNRYKGRFDGDGHTVFGVYVNHTDNGAGFFGCVDEAGEVCGLTVSGKIIGSKSYTGGVVGDCYGSVSDCHNLAEVNGYRYTGGVVGDLERAGTIYGCSNLGRVNASDHTVGGIAGKTDSTSSSAVVSCYNTGAISGNTKVGGVVGDQYGYGSVISDVYNVGSVTARTGYAGGILGNMRVGTLRAAYMAADVQGGSAAARGKIVGTLEAQNQQRIFDKVYYINNPEYDVIANLNGCTVQNGSAEAKSEDELKALADNLGDEFATDSNSINDGYPILKWQIGESTAPEAPPADPSGWDGITVSEPALKDGVYQIGTAAELAWFAQQVESHPVLDAVLVKDIDLNNRPWSPIGGATEQKAYQGSFDGNGYAVKNLYVYSKKPAAAFFAGNAGSISGLTLEGLINGADYAAAIAAYNYGSIDHCKVEVVLNAGNYAGGITASNAGAVSDCAADSVITASKYAGGICGFNTAEGAISRCVNVGQAESKADFAGGVCAANEGTVNSCYNRGLVIGNAALLRSYVGGVVGWNNNQVIDAYNTGAVISPGSYVGGVVGISTNGTTAQNLYGVGSVMGMYYDDDEAYEQYYVGAAVGRKNSSVSNVYYLNTLAVGGDGYAKSAAEMKAKGFPVQLGNEFVKDENNLNDGYPVLKWQTAENTPQQTAAISGSVVINGDLKSGSKLIASYTDGNATDLVYVWYTADTDGEYVLAVGNNTYTVPVDLVGQTIRVKVFSTGYSGFVETAASAKIEGMSGSVSISGPAVVGKTLTASYSRPDDNPTFQWYRGNAAIVDATTASYKITADDIGYLLKVRVYGNKDGYVEKVMTARVSTAEAAGVWVDDECEEPANVGGEYVITNEKELHWFVSAVNGGNTELKAKLANDLTLTADKWYPIGTDKSQFSGKFDGNNKTVSNFVLSANNKAQQGFFGVVTGNGEVKNLTVDGNVAVSGTDAVSIGGIAGYVEGKISGCTFKGEVSGYSQVGGIAGAIGLHGMITECRNIAAVDGNEQIGGIAGANSYGDTYFCVNNGDIGSEDSVNVGGIIGDTQNYAVITGCYNTGDVVGRSQVGGISGKVYVASAPLGCYSAGSVSGGLYTGGVLGSIGGTDYISTVKGSFYLNTLPKDSSAVAVSEKEMKATSFVRSLNSDAFTECYTADKTQINDGYPVLNWEISGPGGSGEETPSKPQKERITVSFTLLGDTVHGDNPHNGGTVTWIDKVTLKGLPNTTTAFDLFRKVLDDAGYTYTASGKSYVSDITSPSGLCLSELSNGPYSGWMYTVNGVFPDYMASVTLQDGDDMVFFYTDDYRDTGWNPNGKPGTSSYKPGSSSAVEASTAADVIKLIDAIGNVTQDSGDKIKAARLAYDKLSAAEKNKVSNYNKLTEAEAAFANLSEIDKNGFVDVQNHWAANAIDYVVEKGLFNGTTEKTFEPETAMSRAMLATVIWRLGGKQAAENAMGFADVADSAYYADAVAWANANGIVKGYSDMQFAPNDNITREQLAVILYRYAAAQNYELSADGDLTDFADGVAISDYAEEAVAWAVCAGIIKGDNGKINPQGAATRAEVAAMLQRFAENVVK